MSTKRTQEIYREWDGHGIAEYRTPINVWYCDYCAVGGESETFEEAERFARSHYLRQHEGDAK